MLSDIYEIEDFYEKQFKNSPINLITYLGKYASITKDAREYLEEKGSDLIAKNAIIIQSLAQRMIVDHYVRVKKHDTPTKVFDNIVDAYDWLKEK
ncbi:MAG: hypothetical protein ABEH43_08440 [Flavobacteriales bacterium]